MNERIKELAQQAGLDMTYLHCIEGNSEDLMRFAELIDRKWVSLTDEDISKAKTLLKDNDPEYAIFFIMNRLQEYNTCR